MMKDCKLCDLHIKRNNVVEGIGKPSSNIMFIFFSPNYRQDKTGIFRANESINRFMGYLSDYGFNEENSYFTLLVKCKLQNAYNMYNINNNLDRSIEICTNDNLRKEYYYNGKKKKLLVLIGDEVAFNIFKVNSFHYFKAYHLMTPIVVTPSINYFIKGGLKATRRLSYIRELYNSLNV